MGVPLAEMSMAKQSRLEWNDYGLFGLPSEREALFEGCVGELPRSWDHAAVFLARKKTIAVLRSDVFFFGVPRHVGDKRSDFAYKRVRDSFCESYEFYCKKVRSGEVLICEASIRPYMPRLDAVEVAPVAGDVVKAVHKEVGDKALAAMRAKLLGQD